MCTVCKKTKTTNKKSTTQAVPPNIASSILQLKNDTTAHKRKISEIENNSNTTKHNIDIQKNKMARKETSVANMTTNLRNNTGQLSTIIQRQNELLENYEHSDTNLIEPRQALQRDVENLHNKLGDREWSITFTQ